MMLWYGVFLSINICFDLVSCLWWELSSVLDSLLPFCLAHTRTTPHSSFPKGDVAHGCVLNNEMRAEIALSGTARPGAPLGSSFLFDYSPYYRGMQGIMKRIPRPQEIEGHKLEESGPPVPVWKSSHWIPTLNFWESKKTKKQNNPSIVLYHPEFGVC